MGNWNNAISICKVRAVRISELLPYRLARSDNLAHKGVNKYICKAIPILNDLNKYKFRYREKYVPQTLMISHKRLVSQHVWLLVNWQMLNDMLVSHVNKGILHLHHLDKSLKTNLNVNHKLRKSSLTMQMPDDSFRRLCWIKRKDVISFVTHNSHLEILKCTLFKKKN